MYKQVFDPVGDSLGLSSIFAAIPIVVLFVLLGGLKMKAHWASLIALGAAILVALIVYGMPVGQALDSAAEGAVFGIFPIMYIVFMALWIYNMTVDTGHFAVLRRAFNRISDDQRIQAVIIAFSFGALLEALAGFGTPVAITAVMLIAVGFTPIKAAAVALVSNTAPVAFGAIAIPIVTLSEITGLPKDDLGAMVGRQTPILALIVPLILVGMVDGGRGIRQAWPAAVVGGFTFALGQFVCSNYISVELTDIVASLLSAGSIVLLLQVWKPSEPLRGEVSAGGAQPAIAGAATADATHEREIKRKEGNGHDSTAEIFAAFAPYLIIIAVFSLAQWGPIKDFLDERTHAFDWPGLNIQNPDGEAPSSVDVQVQLGQRRRHPAARLGAADDARAALPARARLPHAGADAGRAEVGDAHRRDGAGAGLRDEPLRPDHHARPVDRRRGRDPAVPLPADRLARRRGDGLRHLVELAVRHAPGGGGAEGRLLADAARRGQLLRRRARQDDLAAEPRDRRRRGRTGRP